MTRLLHIIGPQGAGKSTLAHMIVRGAYGQAAHVDWEEARSLSNAQIRAHFAGLAVVCVESLCDDSRHLDLQHGDAVMRMHATTEASHAG